MKRLIIIGLLAILGIFSSIASAQNQLPIIDMHLHSYGGILSEVRMCFPEPCEKVSTQAADADQLLSMTLEQMDKHNIVLGVLSGNDYLLNMKWVNADPRFIYGYLVSEPDKIDLELLHKDIKERKIKIMGEVTSQYYGYSMNDPQLDTVFSIAEANDLPVLVHSAGLGGTPHFPIEKGNPISLNDVIRNHPKLRVYVENAAWPFGEEIIALMYTNPNVYADLSTISWIIPRKTFHSYLRKLIDAGLSDRLMFGSDQMIWPESIDLAIDAIKSADFLSEEQKRDIFYNNAARFLKLSEEDIKQHHNRFKAANKK
jgi:predicted TIM-barrel fold metal-dependent hydrolase